MKTAPSQKLIKMFHFRLSLLLISFEILCILGGHNDAAPSSSHGSSKVLPLVLMQYGFNLSNPTTIKKAAFVDDGNALSGETTFDTLLQGTKQIFTCAIKPLTGNTSKVNNPLENPFSTDDHYCTYLVKFNLNDPLRCTDEPEPLASKPYSPDGAHLSTISCGPNRRGKMYFFLYKICMTDEAYEYEKLLQNDISGFENNPTKYLNHFEVYRVCYDEDTNEILHTKHRLLSPKLLSDDAMKQEWNKEYEMSIEGYYSFQDHFKTVKDAYIKLENLSSSHPDEYPYQAQKLVPSEDMAFALWKKPIHHFLNVKPMHKKLLSLWEHINKLIRKTAHDQGIQFQILTGAFPVPGTTPKINMDNIIQAPNVWIKIVYHFYEDREHLFKNDAAIVMVEDLDDEIVANFHENICKKNLFEGIFDHDFPEISKFVKCCPFTKEIDTFFETNMYTYPETYE